MSGNIYSYRRDLKRAYPGKIWEAQVDELSDEHVIALYHRLAIKKNSGR